MSPPQPASLCRFIFISGHVLGSDCAHRSSNWNLFTLILTFSPSRLPSRFALFFLFFSLPFFSLWSFRYICRQSRPYLPCINERMREGTFSQSNHALPWMWYLTQKENQQVFGSLPDRQDSRQIIFFSSSKVSVNYLTYTIKLQEGI